MSFEVSVRLLQGKFHDSESWEKKQCQNCVLISQAPVFPIKRGLVPEPRDNSRESSDPHESGHLKKCKCGPPFLTLFLQI